MASLRSKTTEHGTEQEVRNAALKGHGTTRGQSSNSRKRAAPTTPNNGNVHPDGHIPISNLDKAWRDSEACFTDTSPEGSKITVPETAGPDRDSLLLFRLFGHGVEKADLTLDQYRLLVGARADYHAGISLHDIKSRRIGTKVRAVARLSTKDDVGGDLAEIDAEWAAANSAFSPIFQELESVPVWNQTQEARLAGEDRQNLPSLQRVRRVVRCECVADELCADCEQRTAEFHNRYPDIPKYSNDDIGEVLDEDDSGQDDENCDFEEVVNHSEGEESAAMFEDDTAEEPVVSLERIIDLEESSSTNSDMEERAQHLDSAPAIISDGTLSRKRVPRPEGAYHNVKIWLSDEQCAILVTAFYQTGGKVPVRVLQDTALTDMQMTRFWYHHLAANGGCKCHQNKRVSDKAYWAEYLGGEEVLQFPSYEESLE